MRITLTCDTVPTADYIHDRGMSKADLEFREEANRGWGLKVEAGMAE